jgi:hypothetical protein
MNHKSDQIQEVSAPTDGPRSNKDIIANLSKPVNPRRLKQRTDWRYEIRSVSEVGDNSL